MSYFSGTYQRIPYEKALTFHCIKAGWHLESGTGATTSSLVHFTVYSLWYFHVSCYVDLQNSKNKCLYIFGEIRYFACQSYFRSFPYIQYTRKMKPNNTEIKGTPVKKFIMGYWQCWQSFRVVAQSPLARYPLARSFKRFMPVGD